MTEPYHYGQQKWENAVQDLIIWGTENFKGLQLSIDKKKDSDGIFDMVITVITHHGDILQNHSTITPTDIKSRSVEHKIDRMKEVLERKAREVKKRIHKAHIMRVDLGEFPVWIAFDADNQVRGGKRDSKNAVKFRYENKYSPNVPIQWTVYKGIARPAEFAVTAANLKLNGDKQDV